MDTDTYTQRLQDAANSKDDIVSLNRNDVVSILADLKKLQCNDDLDAVVWSALVDAGFDLPGEGFHETGVSWAGIYIRKLAEERDNLRDFQNAEMERVYGGLRY